jgi:hypothetical protein
MSVRIVHWWYFQFVYVLKFGQYYIWSKIEVNTIVENEKKANNKFKQKVDIW